MISQATEFQTCRTVEAGALARWRLSSVRILSVGLVLALLGTAGASAEEYKLQPGDVLDFSVVGIADMHQKLPVDINGQASFPLIGELQVAGMTVSAVRSEVQRQLPKRSLTIRTNDGKEVVTVVSGDEITIAIAENRPIYMKGDVAKPGELIFKPGLDVRQAVALAGGYDLVRFKTENPILEAAELRGEYESLWADFVSCQSAIIRLRAEYDGAKDMNRKDLAQVPLPASVVDAVFKNERDRFASRVADYEREKAHIASGVKVMDARISELSAQKIKETEGAKIDESEIERIGDLQRRGVVPVTREVETRRLSLLSATRALQVGTSLEEARKARDDLARSSVRLDDQRKSDIAKDLQDATVKLAQTRSKIAAVGEKLLYTGVLKTQLVRDSGGPPSITVYRRGRDGGTRKITGDEDTPLEPGDAIDVALNVAYDPSGAYR